MFGLSYVLIAPCLDCPVFGLFYACPVFGLYYIWIFLCMECHIFLIVLCVDCLIFGLSYFWIVLRLD